jgi:hypothetical protein
MKIKNIFIISFLVYILFGCNNSTEVYEIQIIDDYIIKWDNDKRWIIEDENFKKLKEDFEDIELKLIQCLLDTTLIGDVCFKDKPLKKGDIALFCLINIGSTHQLYDPDMLKVKRLDHNDPCYFVYYNNIYHLENNRQKYYNYIINNKINDIRN